MISQLDPGNAPRDFWPRPRDRTEAADPRHVNFSWHEVCAQEAPTASREDWSYWLVETALRESQLAVAIIKDSVLGNMMRWSVYDMSLSYASNHFTWFSVHN